MFILGVNVAESEERRTRNKVSDFSLLTYLLLRDVLGEEIGRYLGGEKKERERDFV